MSERDYLLAAIERCETRARIARGNLDRFTLVPGNPSSERTYRKLKEDWREATEHAEHLRQRLQRSGRNFLAYVTIRTQPWQTVRDKIADSPMGDNHVPARTHRFLKCDGH
jgi:hypothetical protein